RPLCTHLSLLTRNAPNDCHLARQSLTARGKFQTWRVGYGPKAGRSLSAAAADCLDQLPLAHLRAARDVAVLRELVQLLAVAILECVPGRAAAAGALASLGLEPAPRALGQMRDRPLRPRGRLRLLHVSSGCLKLACRCHGRHLQSSDG